MFLFNVMIREDSILVAPLNPIAPIVVGPKRETLSIVIPVLDEALNVRLLREELERVLVGLGVSWELLFVDDGSQDTTWSQICALHREDPRIQGLRFSRNFGHQYALFAGLMAARGDAVITMDGDLQHPPALVPKLVEAWRAGYRIVHTVRVDDDHIPRLKKVLSRLFYRVFSFLSGTALEQGMADFRLLDRQVVDQLSTLREEGLFLRGLVQWVGFPSTKVRFVVGRRAHGGTKYSLRRMVRLAWNGTTSFSLVPLRTAILLGVFTAVLAFGELAFAVSARLFTNTTVPGWASAVGVLSFLFGILFILIGIVGEYIGRILIEARGRPRFIVQETVGLSAVPVDFAVARATSQVGGGGA